jgi:hypothetical protein
MDAATLIKYALAIQGISALDVKFDPPDGRIAVRYINRDGAGAKEITFAELSNLLTTSNLRPPEAPPG